MSPDQGQDPEDSCEDPNHTSDPNRVGVGMTASSSDFARQSRKINDQKNDSGNERYNDQEGNDPKNHGDT
jgi:hypothetical protein